MLIDWAANMREGYTNLGVSSVGFADYIGVPSGSSYREDYSLEEKLCLNEMMIIRVTDQDLYKVASLEYIEQSRWIGDCRIAKGWIDNNGNKNKVAKPNRSDFIDYANKVHGINKNTYYNRLNKLQRRIYERVVI